MKLRNSCRSRWTNSVDSCSPLNVLSLLTCKTYPQTPKNVFRKVWNRQDHHLVPQTSFKNHREIGQNPVFGGYFLAWTQHLGNTRCLNVDQSYIFRKRMKNRCVLHVQPSQQPQNCLSYARLDVPRTKTSISALLMLPPVINVYAPRRTKIIRLAIIFIV